MPVIDRNLADPLRRRLRHYPVVTVTGPRQSGKTTLCRTVLADRPYVSLESIDMRTYAREDPRGFLGGYRHGAVIDEVQRAPDLTSYLQGVVDEDPAPGRFVLTGSQHFGLAEAVSQSLAGRVGILHLLPPGLDELARFGGPPPSLLRALWTGAYPRIHDRGIPADVWLRDYLATYVERDVRSLRNVTDLEAFSGFVRLAAGRTATEVNLSALAGDVGVRHNTVRAWLSVLEASFLAFRVSAYRRNVRKRQVKAPKLHFLDTGLACHLLGIRSPEELRHHPLRGQIFESWVASEVFKAAAHRGEDPRLHHYRAAGTEVDLVVDRGSRLILVEAKSGSTVAPRFFSGMRTLGDALEKSELTVERRLVYGGDLRHQRGGTEIVPWDRMLEIAWD
ncbi:ATP-binding protein [Candidatus Palauibacter sp.]|uniref:ATP-binding protein n=1 Tax=Candidatus Palauibacter sp. TaxID=3101350 RepID=UPI003B52BEBB